ncbi:MAG: hypothetical protein QOJ68_1278 [Blastococcus sp.]|jgi:hypothetical protein|nr:hypothetical protein [Blastococcus sp.]
MSVVESSPGPAAIVPPARPRGSLFRAELHRFRARRFIRLLLLLAVLGWVLAVVIALLHYGTPTAADRAQARQTMQQVVAQSEQGRQDCLKNPQAQGAPPGVSPEDACGPPMQLSDLDENNFLPKQPFDLASSGGRGAIGFGAAAAVLGFVIGATWIGAEWSSRSLVALLFWVPRRMSVFGAKIAVLTLAGALLGVVAQAAWLAMATILRVVAGDGRALPAQFWGHLFATQGRAVLLTVLIALLGFGLTNLIRNTGAALGAGFVYFAIVETAVRAVQPAWEPWLLSTNAAALVSPGGLPVYIYDAVGRNGFTEPRVYLISNLQAGIELTAVVCVIIGIGVWLFNRRDVH